MAWSAADRRRQWPTTFARRPLWTAEQKLVTVVGTRFQGTVPTDNGKV